jgi:acetoacetyl-CoA synthetase
VEQPGRRLLGGTTICLFDGSPGGPSKAPDWPRCGALPRFTKTTFFGAGAAFYASCLKAGVSPKDAADLGSLRALGSTGSPLANECYRWAWDHCPKVDGRDIWLTPMSGGTDFAGAFIAGLPTLPMVEGEMQCRCLGSAVEAWSEPDAAGRGRSLIDEVGELVCTRPMPSMPLYLWGDTDGQRLHDSYFDMYPGIWRHGDWIRTCTPSAAAPSSTAAATPRSTGTASAWAPPSCTARSRRCPRCSTAWSSTSNTSAARATCRCSSCCARACARRSA